MTQRRISVPTNRCRMTLRTLLCLASAMMAYAPNNVQAREIFGPIDILREADNKALADKFDTILKQNSSIAQAARRLSAPEQTGLDESERHLLLGTLELQMGRGADAEKELQKSREAGSNSTALSLLLAKADMQQGKYKQALQEVAAPNASPKLVAALLLTQASAHQSLNNAQAALASLQGAKRLMPDWEFVSLLAASIELDQHDLISAKQDIDRALHIENNDLDALIIKARILAEMRNLPEAIGILDEAIFIAPDFPAAKILRATLLLQQGQDAKADADVTDVLVHYPKIERAIYLKGLLLLRAKDYAGADLAFERINLENFPRAFLLDAIAKEHRNAPEQALKLIQRYVTIAPSDPDGAKVLARLLRAAGKDDRAIAALEAVRQTGTADAEALDSLGNLYAANTKPTAAVDAFKQALKLAPQNPDIATHLAIAKLSVGDDRGAADDLERLQSVAPLSVRAGEALATAYLTMGELERASQTLDTLREQGDHSLAVQRLNLRLLIIKQDLNGARAQLESMIAADPTQSRLKVELARLLMLLLHQDEADAILYKLLDSAPQNIEARAMLVQSLLATNRVPQAIAFLRSVTAVPSPNPGEGLALANLYLRTNAPDQALETLDRLDAGGRATEQTLLTRASALVAIHHADDARDAYRRALALAPTNPTAVRELIRLDIAANDWNDARTVIRNALRLLPTDPSLLRLRVRIDFLSGGEAAAKATIARLQSDATSRGGAAALYADLDFDAGHYRQAADAYVILAKQTSNGHYIVGAFEAFNAAKQPDLAKSTLRDWLAQHPDDLEVLRVSINLELTNLRYDVAKPLLERALLIAPSDAVTLNNLAFIYDEQHDPRAQSMARRAFQVQPSPQSADTLGWIMVKQGAANQALPLLSYAARAMKSTGVVQLHFATALRDTGDRAQAIAVLSPLATLQPGFAELSVAQKMLHELQAVN